MSKFIKSLYLNDFILDFGILIVIFLTLFHLDLMRLNLNLTVFDCLKIDSLSTFFKLLIDANLLGILIVSKKYYFLERVIFFEYVVLVLLSAEGSFLLLIANNLFLFYLAVEVQNLNYYILAASKRYSSFSIEAGLKYFLLGAFSSGLLIFGVSLIFGSAGELNYDLLHYLLVNSELGSYQFMFNFGLIFLLIGLLFKLGAVPFHWWVVDVYVGSPTVITMLFSIIPKIVYIFVLIKFILYFFLHEPIFFGSIFFITGLLSVVVGFINAMFQEDLKKFLAYSTISNIGFMLMGLSTFDIYVFVYVILYLICYLISVFGIFFCIILFRKNGLVEIKSIFDLALFTRYSWLLGFFVSMNFFSFAGIPPFAGFFAKLLLFISMMETYFFLGIVLLLISSVISVFYYIRLVRFLFFTETKEYATFFLRYLEFFIFVSLLNMFFVFFLCYF